MHFHKTTITVLEGKPSPDLFPDLSGFEFRAFGLVHTLRSMLRSTSQPKLILSRLPVRDRTQTGLPSQLPATHHRVDSFTVSYTR
jgi:hypothetical protein